MPGPAARSIASMASSRRFDVEAPIGTPARAKPATSRASFTSEAYAIISFIARPPLDPAVIPGHVWMAFFSVGQLDRLNEYGRRFGSPINQNKWATVQSTAQDASSGTQHNHSCHGVSSTVGPLIFGKMARADVNAGLVDTQRVWLYFLPFASQKGALAALSLSQPLQTASARRRVCRFARRTGRQNSDRH